jgi:hypothetical protein
LAGRSRASAQAEGGLFHSPNFFALAKLIAVLHLHQLTHSWPAANAIFVSADVFLLESVVVQWRESLTLAEASEVRGALLESRLPIARDLARAPLHL